MVYFPYLFCSIYCITNRIWVQAKKEIFVLFDYHVVFENKKRVCSKMNFILLQTIYFVYMILFRNCFAKRCQTG